VREDKNQYFFSDFTEKNYRRILELAICNGYKFITYGEAHKSKGKNIILRHDIDFSPQRALALAKVEQKVGIKTTYYVYVGSLFYNVFESDIKTAIFRILQLGHPIGLHFDPQTYCIRSEDELLHWLMFEKKILVKLFNCKVRSFSFHNPSSRFVKQYDKAKYAGMFNSYGEIFQKKFVYCSDSNGYWRYDRLQSIIISDKYKNLHVLIHPGWWQDKVSTPWERVQRCLEGRKQSVSNAYCNILRKSKRKNVGR